MLGKLAEGLEFPKRLRRCEVLRDRFVLRRIERFLPIGFLLTLPRKIRGDWAWFAAPRHFLASLVLRLTRDYVICGVTLVTHFALLIACSLACRRSTDSRVFSNSAICGLVHVVLFLELS